MAGAGRDSSAAHRDSELELGLVIVDLLEPPQKLGEERPEEVLRLCVHPLGELQQEVREEPSQAMPSGRLFFRIQCWTIALCHCDCGLGIRRGHRRVRVTLGVGRTITPMVPCALTLLLWPPTEPTF